MKKIRPSYFFFCSLPRNCNHCRRTEAIEGNSLGKKASYRIIISPELSKTTVFLILSELTTFLANSPNDRQISIKTEKSNANLNLKETNKDIQNY